MYTNENHRLFTLSFDPHTWKPHVYDFSAELVERRLVYHCPMAAKLYTQYVRTLSVF